MGRVPGVADVCGFGVVAHARDPLRRYVDAHVRRGLGVDASIRVELDGCHAGRRVGSGIELREGAEIGGAEEKSADRIGEDAMEPRREENSRDRRGVGAESRFARAESERIVDILVQLGSTLLDVARERVGEERPMGWIGYRRARHEQRGRGERGGAQAIVSRDVRYDGDRRCETSVLDLGLVEILDETIGDEARPLNLAPGPNRRMHAPRV